MLKGMILPVAPHGHRGAMTCRMPCRWNRSHRLHHAWPRSARCKSNKKLTADAIHFLLAAESHSRGPVQGAGRDP